MDKINTSKNIENTKENDNEIKEEKDKRIENEDKKEIIKKKKIFKKKDLNNENSKLQKIEKIKVNKEFEKDIMEAYKKLSIGDDSSDSKVINNKIEKESIIEMSESKNLKFCEKKLRSALNICENSPELVINRKIIDKLGRLSNHNKMNLNYIIGYIYISLMNKEVLFDYEEEDFDLNDILIFVNKAIDFKDIMKNTKIGISYNDTLMKFLYRVIEQFELEEEQLNGIKAVLETNKEMQHNNILCSFIGDLELTLSEELEKQPNIYEQYQIFEQNKTQIINLIEECDLTNENNYQNYVRLGKILAYLFYNKSFTLYVEDNDKKDENEVEPKNRYYIFDGYDNKNELNIINSEKYFISEDKRIKEFQENLCEIILKYIEKFIHLIDLFIIQYVIYTLIKRIYFCNYDKYRKRVLPLLADSLTNMCFFKDSSLKIISKFINKILNSTKNEDLDLKNMLIENLNLAKKEKNFLYKFPKSFNLKLEEEQKEDHKEKEKSKDKKELDNLKNNSKDEEEDDEKKDKEDINKIKDEVLLLCYKDLKIGFFNSETISAGEKFVFYEEISKEYSVLDFCLTLEGLDIKFLITDLTEGRKIFSKERLYSTLETPLKISMFFTSPRILKFEFDNMYSWFKSKTIKYKCNIFYPDNPYSIGHQILVTKYQKTILQTKNKIIKKKKKVKKNKNQEDDEGYKFLIFKNNGENLVFNCSNVKDNLDTVNQMVKDKYLSIYSLFIKVKNKEKNEDKSYFYYQKENEGLIENELTKEKFENYLINLLSKSKGNLNIMNLYIINGDSTINHHYYNHNLQKLLGFEQNIKIEGKMPKILYFIQYLQQAQLIYFLYKQVFNQEQIDNVLLINYNKFGGYQIILFNKEEIIYNLSDFKGLNKDKSLEENAKIIGNGIKILKNDEDKKINVVLPTSVDSKENEIIPEKLEKKIMELIGDDENDKQNISIIKTNFDFNDELQINSHIFYIDN